MLSDSYRHWTGSALIATREESRLAEALFHAPFVLVSHGTEPVPLFNYANQKALELFGVDWETFIRMPSRQSADREVRAERAELMARVKAEGYATNCSGVRVTADGKRFRIDGATIWNVIDRQGRYHGQAAVFDQWFYL